MGNQSKKPVTTAQFFALVCRRLEEGGWGEEMLELLDYAHPTAFMADMEAGAEIRHHLGYSGNGGITLELSAACVGKDGGEIEYPLGRFKSRQDTPEAMRRMAALLADFIIYAGDIMGRMKDDAAELEPYQVYVHAALDQEFRVMAGNREEAEQKAGQMINDGKVALNMKYNIQATKCMGWGESGV